MDMSQQQTRRSESAIRAELIAMGARFKGKTCTCPFHDDKHASAGIYCGDDGAWRFKCQVPTCGVGGDVFDLMARRTGKSLADVLRESADVPPTSPPPKIYASIDDLASAFRATAHYVYSNPSTRHADLIVLRRDPAEPGEKKDFVQCHQVDGGFVMKAPAKPWPIYNRSRVASADTVIFVEGEKVVHALHAAGHVATTTPAGAGKSEYADLSPLAGKRVYLWPDNDDTGISHMQDVMSRLERLEPPCACHWINPEPLGLSKKGDAVDYLDAVEGTPDDKREAVNAVLATATATTTGPAAEIRERLRAIAAGELEVIGWPWDLFGRGTQALIPGSITLIGGDPGATKSFLLMQAAAFWHGCGVPVAIFEVEKDRKYHLQRALAQRSRCSMLTDMQWCRTYPSEAAHLLSQHEGWCDSFGTCIHDRKGQGIKLNEMADWVDRMGAAGKRIIAIDPISLCTAGRDRFLADEEFMSRVEQSVTKHGSSLILITHPVKNNKNSSIGSSAGGAVYERECDTFVWVNRHDEPKEVEVRSPAAQSESFAFARRVTCNRTVKLLKTRNGRGSGWNIAFQFDGESLTFEELGGIKRSVRGDREREEVA